MFPVVTAELLRTTYSQDADVHSGWPARLPSVLSQKFLRCRLASVVPTLKLVPLG
jgi:hypothetical protein